MTCAGTVVRKRSSTGFPPACGPAIPRMMTGRHNRRSYVHQQQKTHGSGREAYLAHQASLPRCEICGDSGDIQNGRCRDCFEAFGWGEPARFGPAPARPNLDSELLRPNNGVINLTLVQICRDCGTSLQGLGPEQTRQCDACWRAEQKRLAPPGAPPDHFCPDCGRYMGGPPDGPVGNLCQRCWKSSHDW